MTLLLMPLTVVKAPYEMRIMRILKMAICLFGHRVRGDRNASVKVASRIREAWESWDSSGIDQLELLTHFPAQ
jgi:hypothetical protein